MSGLKTFFFLIIVGFAFCEQLEDEQPNPWLVKNNQNNQHQENQEPRRTCRQSLMAGLRSIFEDEANANCVSLSFFAKVIFPNF